MSIQEDFSTLIDANDKKDTYLVVILTLEDVKKNNLSLMQSTTVTFSFISQIAEDFSPYEVSFTPLAAAEKLCKVSASTWKFLAVGFKLSIKF